MGWRRPSKGRAGMDLLKTIVFKRERDPEPERNGLAGAISRPSNPINLASLPL
jgi:hypothetical protein